MLGGGPVTRRRTSVLADARTPSRTTPRKQSASRSAATEKKEPVPRAKTPVRDKKQDGNGDEEQSPLLSFRHALPPNLRALQDDTADEADEPPQPESSKKRKRGEVPTSDRKTRSSRANNPVTNESDSELLTLSEIKQRKTERVVMEEDKGPARPNPFAAYASPALAKDRETIAQVEVLRTPTKTRCSHSAAGNQTSPTKAEQWLDITPRAPKSGVKASALSTKAKSPAAAVRKPSGATLEVVIPSTPCRTALLKNVRSPGVANVQLSMGTPTRPAKGPGTPKKSPAVGVKHTAKKSASVHVTDEDVTNARKAVLLRLTERNCPRRLIGLDEQFQKIYGLMERTVRRGESNSVLLVGNRGTGKSTVIKKAFTKLSRTFQSSASTAKPFYEVHLSGLFHTDDRQALRDIVRQLQSQQLAPSSSAEALLETGSFAACLAYVLESLNQGTLKSTPVIFVLEEVDLLANHPKQALLYNLFDMCQSGKNPVAVIGVTCRIDFITLLEKRVKSRFSHRRVDLYPPDSMAGFLAIAQEACSLAVSPSSEVELDSDAQATEADDDGVTNAAYVALFNEKALDNFLNHPLVLRGIKTVFEQSKDVRKVFRFLYPLAAELSTLNPYLGGTLSPPASPPPTPSTHMTSSPKAPSYINTSASTLETIPIHETLGGALHTAPKQSVIQSLSLLEIMLLVASVQLFRRHSNTISRTSKTVAAPTSSFTRAPTISTSISTVDPVFNFEMVYDEYRDFLRTSASSSSSNSVAAVGGKVLQSKNVAQKAFERLMVLRLCVGVDGVGIRCPKGWRMVRLGVGVREVEQAVKAGNLPTEVGRWALGRA
ncbi:origin recognition complex subunit 4 C-terminus-domain-containing protein [Fimicolochytrium jonesii]|uniref:origin recognition complex subunit 4 C-terminus-domain-containing protein n=1 Tax=Fimicolochytrium jonesii TaxID=1396493 RepID=UPI0022FE94CD|nr:origin recognition complex subunit 4 C-terminus-domain-containing protein [Fimicolochytrium jonesii]KAI8820474.1 origin recognition complex subunit 4 C-terminus-domain-containing protein [Fimicolochytrium jonesii]